MRVLNLTPDFNPFSKIHNRYPTVKIKVDDIWSGGEIKFQLDSSSISLSTDFLITTRLNNSNDIMRLLLATNALRDYADSIKVFIPYLPYARQDRVCNYGEPFSLQVFADLINSQNYTDVMMYDPHSNVSSLLIKNSDAYDNFTFVREVVERLDRPLTIVTPDAGSFKKGQDLVKYLNNPELYEVNHEIEHLPCLKTRNKETGAIDQYMLPECDLTGKECLIVDDIADGGRTFIALCLHLKSKGATKVYLAVSHGIFSGGFGPLVEGGIDHIYSTDSIRTYNQEFLQIQEIHSIYTHIKLEDVI